MFYGTLGQTSFKRDLQCFANIYLNWFRDISSSLTSLHLFEKEIKTSPEFPSTSILPLPLSLENLLESGSDFWIFSGLPAAVISAPWNCTWPQHQEAPRGGCSSGWRFRSTPPPHTHTLVRLPAEGLGQAYGQFWLPDAHLVPSASVSGGK